MFSYIDRNRGRPRCRGVEPHRQGTHVPRILVADDNTNIQKMVALAFHDRGIDVTSVGNGEAAIRRLPDLNPDLILADIFMPVRNGYEVCEWVKKDPKFSHIPVILLVGAFDPLDEKEARRVGADGVLKKPFIPPDPLIAMVTSVLEKNSKIASETAKAQEIVAAPTPIPVAAAQTPVRVEATPVPEFPEPNPEETPLVYAFGSGRRTLDDEGSGEPAGSPGPSAEIHQEPEEEFEGASTTKDWRRSAMEFEIPEERPPGIRYSRPTKMQTQRSRLKRMLRRSGQGSRKQRRKLSRSCSNFRRPRQRIGRRSSRKPWATSRRR
jgi:CheY-like chemotaxis protein